MGNSKGGGGAAKATVGRPKVTKVFRQNVTGATGPAGKMKPAGRTTVGRGKAKK